MYFMVLPNSLLEDALPLLTSVVGVERSVLKLLVEGNSLLSAASGDICIELLAVSGRLGCCLELLAAWRHRRHKLKQCFTQTV